MSTTGRDATSFSSQRRRRRVKNKHCNLTLKTLTRSFKDSAMFPRDVIVISLPCVCCKILAPLSHLRAVCTYVKRQGIKIHFDVVMQSLKDILVSNVLRSARFFVSFSL